MTNHCKIVIVKKYLVKTWLILLIIFIFNLEKVYAQKQFERIVKKEQKISLENTLSVPHAISIDKQGNIITTNSNHVKMKVYDKQGNLLHLHGRKGKGPGEFLRPTSTIRLSSGQLLRVGLEGKLSLYNATGDSLLNDYTVRLFPLGAVYKMDKNRVLLVGRNRTAEQIKLLHVFDLSKGRIIKSFFNLPIALTRQDDSYGGVFATFENIAKVDIKNGKIAVMLAPFTVIKIYNFDGKLQKSITLNFKYFKKAKKINRLITSFRKLTPYLTSFSMVSDIFWLDNHSFIINYYDLTEFNPHGTGKKQNTLVKVNLNGMIYFEISGTPALRAVQGNNLYFLPADYENGLFLIKAKLVNN